MNGLIPFEHNYLTLLFLFPHQNNFILLRIEDFLFTGAALLQLPLPPLVVSLPPLPFPVATSSTFLFNGFLNISPSLLLFNLFMAPFLFRLPPLPLHFHIFFIFIYFYYLISPSPLLFILLYIYIYI